MSISSVTSTAYNQHKTRKKDNQHDDGFESFLLNHQEDDDSDSIPNTCDEGVLTKVSQLPSNIEIIDIMAWAAMQPEKEEIDMSNIQIADLTPLSQEEMLAYELDPQNWSIYFDDPQWIQKARQGILNCQKYFDFTNASDYRKMTENADYTGMSNAEKVTIIMEKYKHCYGEDFMKSFAVEYYPMNNRYADIKSKLYNELTEEFGSIENAWKANREAQYGNISESEVRKAIMEKYMQNDKMTLRNLYEAAQEMDLTGVGYALNTIMFEAFNTGLNGFGTRETLLDLPIDNKCLKQLSDVYNHFLKLNPLFAQTGPVIDDIVSSLSGNFGTKVSKDAILEMMGNQAKSSGGIYIPRELLDNLRK